LWDSSHTEIKGLPPLRGTESLLQFIWGHHTNLFGSPTWSRRIQSVVGRYSHFKPFFLGSSRLWSHVIQGIFMRASCLNYPLDVLVTCSHSPITPQNGGRELQLNYNIQTLVCTPRDEIFPHSEAAMQAPLQPSKKLRRWDLRHSKIKLCC